MIKPSAELRMFVEATHYGDVFPDTTVRANVMYQELGVHGTSKTEWLRRGRALIAFFEEALEGSHTDDELAHMWHSSGAEFYVLAPDIRPLLTFLLEKTKEFQAQNEAGSFVRLDIYGDPWTPRQ